MKIELVGGPECGNVREVKYLDSWLLLDGVKYARRDRPMTLADNHGACYGERGYRFYDAVKGGQNGE
jgi:hypothetical protein